MKRLALILFILICNFSIAQTYQRDSSTLNIFTINDTLKYFEFYMPGYFHGDVEVGILSKTGENVYSLNVNGSDFAPFKLLFQENSVSVKKLSTDGYMAYNLNGKPFLKISDSTSPIVSQFYLNYPTFYKALKNISLKLYDFPCFESKTKEIYFKRGNKIEERWGVGMYNKFKRIKNKTWIAVTQNNKFIGWLLLSDVEPVFQMIGGIKGY